MTNFTTCFKILPTYFLMKRGTLVQARGKGRQKLNKAVNFRLPLFMAASLALGIAGAVNFISGKIFAGVLFCLPVPVYAAAYLLFFAEREQVRRGIVFSIVCLLCFCAGTGGMLVQLKLYENAARGNHVYAVTAAVKEKTVTDYGSVLVIDDITLSGVSGGKSYYNAAVYVYGESPAGVGDMIEFSAALLDREPFFENRFSASYIAENIKYTANVNAADISVKEHSPDIFQRVNLFIGDALMRGLPKEEFGVAYALLTGNSEFMGEQTLENYRNAGVAHIFAVSGLHIGFFAAALGFVLRKLRVNKFVTAAAVVCGCVFYAGVCGFSASALRAVVMCAAAYMTSLFGERYDGFSSVGIAAFILLVFNPAQLYCAGFMLSFGAVLGILLLSGPFARVFKFLPAKLANSLGAVLGAQIACIPISLMAFGQFSLFSVLANLVLLPITGVIFVSLFIAAVLAGIFELPVLLYAHMYILRFVNMCISAIDYKYFIVGGAVFGGFTVLYYAACVTASGIINLKPKVRRFTAICLCAAFLAGTVGFNLVNATSCRMYVTHNERLSAALIKEGGSADLIIAKNSGSFSVSSLKRAAAAANTETLDDVIIMGEAPDVQRIVSGLAVLFDVKRVWYYGEEDLMLTAVMKKSFPDTECVAAKNSVRAASREYTFEDNGKILTFYEGERLSAVFGEAAGYFETDADFYICLAAERPEIISALYKPEKAYSFGYSPYFENAAENGNIVIDLRS